MRDFAFRLVGDEKLVDRLGQRGKLPVEVVPFARPAVAREIRAFDAEPILRMAEDGSAYLTDNGNEVLDCRFPDGIEDAPALERTLSLVPGVVESGLFIGLAHVCVIGDTDGSVEVREKS